MLAAKAQENTFFPSVLTEEAKWLSSQRSPCQRVGRLQDASECTRGARGVAVDWAMQLSIP